jgi:hypothetical protein
VDRRKSILNFGYIFVKALEGLFIDRMESNEEITAQYMNDKNFQTTFERLKEYSRRSENNRYSFVILPINKTVFVH